MNKPKIDKKTLKYGSASIILAVVFIALIFVINLVVTALTERYNLFVDLTEEQLYNISPATEELLKNMGDEEIKLIFLTPLDVLDNDEYTKSVKTIALEYEEKYDNITVEYIDMMKNPGAVAKYRKDYELSSASIIVESAKRFVVFDMYQCFTYDATYQTKTGFNAEYRFTSALIKVTKETMPKALFTSNHLETIPSEFKAILQDAGFDVQLIDLSQNDIPEDTELIIVNDPRKDFSGIESETEGLSEITKLSAYLNNGGNAMIFVGPETPTLKNIDELCASWGIEIAHDLAIVDDYNSISSIDSFAVIAKYANSDENLAAFHKAISSAENPQKTVSYYTAPLKLLPVTDVTHGVGAILSSYGTAYVPLNEKENYAEGEIPVLAAGYKNTYDAERQETVTNYLVVGGSVWFSGDVFLKTYKEVYGNAELLQATVSEMTEETMILNVMPKLYNDTALLIDSATSRKWLIVLLTVLPGIVMVAALAVFLRRRHL